MADLGVTELTLDGAKRMLNLRPNTGLDLLRLGKVTAFRQLSGNTGAPGDEPVDIAMPVLFALLNAPVTGVTKHARFQIGRAHV